MKAEVRANKTEEVIINPEIKIIVLILRDIKKIFKFYKLKILLIELMIWDLLI